jgi:hypothetical protein
MPVTCVRESRKEAADLSTPLRSGRDDNSVTTKLLISPGNAGFYPQTELSSRPERSGAERSAVCSLAFPGYEFVVILRMVLVVLIPFTVGTISTRPPQVVISSAPTMVDVV